LAVHPTSPDTVLVGGIDVNKSTDGGSNWSTITYWTGACAPYSHADQHSIIYRPGYDNEIIVGSDGGVSYSTDVGTSSSPSFTVMNKDFNITQFYSCAMHPDIRKSYFLAGSQDNGSHQFKSAGVSSTTEVTGGDGMFCFIDQSNPDIQITSTYYNDYLVSRDGGNSFSDLFESTNDGRFTNPSDYDNNLHILYSAKSTNSIYRIKNVDTKAEVGIVPMTSLGKIASHIKVSPYTTETSTLFVGTSAGRVFKVTDADNSSYSTTEITGSSFPNGYVSCIEIGASEDELIVIFSNYGISSVWYTSDGGSNWSEKEGDLPDMPVRWALFNPNNHNEAILATEVGIWSTSDLSASSPTWSPSISGLANVRIDMLQIRESDNMVLAATYGRGLFTSNGFSNIDDATLGAYFSVDGSTNLFPGGTVKFQDLSTGTPTTWAWAFEGGTPATSTEQNPAVTYSESGVYEVSLTVGDGTGTETTTRTDYISVSESGGWTEQATGFEAASRGIDFISVVDENIIWAKAYDGASTSNKIKEFTKTTDGGTSWTPGTIDIAGDIYPAMVHAYNADTAWIPMYPNSTGAGGGIYITGDGGSTWTKQTSATFTGDAAFANVVYFWNKDEGFCQGDPNDGYFEIYTTSDGGDTWTRVEQANIPDPSASDEYGTVGLFCVDDDGVAYFNTTKGRIFKSIDKGANWTIITTPLTGRTRIAFADEDNGIIMEAGNKDKAYFTTDGGANWTKISDADLFGSAIAYVPGTERMYVSSSADGDKGAGASYSIDGGKTWSKFNGLDDTQCLAIGFYDMRTGWLGRFSTNSTSGGILKYNGADALPGFSVSPEPKRDATVTFTDITLSEAVGLTYVWDFGTDATPATANTEGPHDVVYSTIGAKTISLTVNGQAITEDITVAVPTSIESEFAKDKFSIYPNPNNGQFNLEINSQKNTDVYLEVYGMNGQIVYFNKFKKGYGQTVLPINMKDVEKGIYIMKVFDGENYQVKKFVIK